MYIVWPLACWDCVFEFRRVHECLSLGGFLCCRLEVSATGRSLVQRSPTECGVSECDGEASIIRWHRPTGGLLSHQMKEKLMYKVYLFVFLSPSLLLAQVLFDPNLFPYKYSNISQTQFILHTYLPMKMEQTECSETSAYKIHILLLSSK